MPKVNLTLEQVVEAVDQLSPDELSQVEQRLLQARLRESEHTANVAMTAAAIEATDWWDAEGDRQWDQWRP